MTKPTIKEVLDDQRITLTETRLLFLEAIIERIIGDDEPEHTQTFDRDLYVQVDARNELRAEQRQRLKEYLR